jgi:hypothetical protein
MANATPLRIGQVNGAGDAKALFLKVFGGEVLTAYETASKTLGKFMLRQIAHGKSAQFPATWKVNASYHTPGAEIVGQVSNVNERVISIDDLLLADVFIPNIDEAMNHFDYRSEYSKQAGISLGTAQDKTILQLMVLAARAAATVTGGPAGQGTITDANMPTDASKIVDAIEDHMQRFDEDDIPESDEKFTFLKPASYYLLTAFKDLVNRDWNLPTAGNFTEAQVMRVKGTTLVKTNNLPTTNIATGPAAYQGDFSKTVAVVATKAAVGTVQLMDLQTEMEYDIRRQGTLIVAKHLKGHGILRPECAGEIADL